MEVCFSCHDKAPCLNSSQKKGFLSGLTGREGWKAITLGKQQTRQQEQDAEGLHPLLQA